MQISAMKPPGGDAGAQACGSEIGSRIPPPVVAELIHSPQMTLLIIADIGICVTAKLFGFSLARFLINRLNLE
jgi:hypothetical protein